MHVGHVDFCVRICAQVQYKISPLAPFSRALWRNNLCCMCDEQMSIKKKQSMFIHVRICKKNNKFSWLQISPFVQVCNCAGWWIGTFGHKMDLSPEYLIKGKSLCGPTLITRGRSSWLIAVARRLHRIVSGLYKHPMQIQRRLKGKCETEALIQDSEVWHIYLRAGKI